MDGKLLKKENHEKRCSLMSEYWKREMGLHRPRTFSRCLYASQALVEQLDLYATLNGHEGCANTVEFNSTGEILVSGSDDRHIMLWDWAAEKPKLSYQSGHLDNIFQAKFMPFTDDRVIITASADCQVRVGQISDGGSVDTKKLSMHQGRVHCLAVEPGSPYIFYSCGEDGFVQHYDLRTNMATKLIYSSSYTKDGYPKVALNSITIDQRNPNYFAVDGADVYARVYDIRRCHLNASTKEGIPVSTFCPSHLIGTHDAHITALAYSNSSQLLVSYNLELIYLFEKDMGLGSNPLSSQSVDVSDPKVFKGHRNVQTVKGVNFFGPSDEYVLSGSDCGHIFIWKKKDGRLIRMMIGDRNVVNQLEPHPTIPILATCGIEKNVKIWAPSSNTIKPLPEDANEIIESNRQALPEDQFTPDVIMHVLRLNRRQTRVFMRRNGNIGVLTTQQDHESDEDVMDYALGFSDGDDLNSEDGETPSECLIS